MSFCAADAPAVRALRRTRSRSLVIQRPGERSVPRTPLSDGPPRRWLFITSVLRAIEPYPGGADGRLHGRASSLDSALVSLPDGALLHEPTEPVLSPPAYTAAAVREVAITQGEERPEPRPAHLVLDLTHVCESGIH
jgi:hypothetical protein